MKKAAYHGAGSPPGDDRLLMRHVVTPKLPNDPRERDDEGDD